MFFVKEANKFMDDAKKLCILGNEFDMNTLLGETDRGYDFEKNEFYDEKGKVVILTDHVFVNKVGVVLTFNFIDDNFILTECSNGVFGLDIGGKELLFNLTSENTHVDLKILDHNYKKFTISDIKNYVETLKKYGIFKEKDFYKIHIKYEEDTKVFNRLGI